VAAAMVNAISIFVTFLISIPALVRPMARGLLKLHGAMAVISAIFTLVLGFDILFSTLKTGPTS